MKFYDGIDADTICASMFTSAAVKLTNRSDVRCYFKVPTLDLMTGLRAIRKDADIRELMQWVPTYRCIEIYVESGVFEEHIPDYIDPNEENEEEDDSDSESSECNSDDLVEIGPPDVQVHVQVHNLADEGEDDDFDTAMRIEHEDLLEVIEEANRVEREEHSKSKTKEGGVPCEEQIYVNNNVNEGDLGDEADDEAQSKTSSVSTVRVVEDSDESEIRGPSKGFTYEEEKIGNEVDEFDSDYHGSEELRSLDSSSDGEESSKPRYPNFIPERDMQDPHFKIGMRFSSAREFKDAVNEYSLKHRKVIRYYTNEKWRVRAMCVGHCEWMIYASKVQGEDTLQVKTFNDHHSNCRLVTKLYSDLKYSNLS